MTDKAKLWQSELEAYIREGEPSRAEKAQAWQTAIGLQDVDGLRPSRYLIDTARQHIEGKITIDAVQARVHEYYQQRGERREIEEGEEEADIVSARIAKILGEKAFHFSPAEWCNIHARLFEGVFEGAGKYRTYNITKSEWVLGGSTVLYASADMIAQTVEYDFSQERAFSYKGLSKREIAHHVAKFASGIWQIHPFCEGNTRSTAVFIIKYLGSMGFKVSNEPFEKSSWYFRNALVRANFDDYEKDIHATREYLNRFFENVLLGENYELRNRFLHVSWQQNDGVEMGAASVTDQVSDQVSDQVKRLLNVMKNGEELSAVELMGRLGLSHRPTFRKNYLNPALQAGLVEMTIPGKPTSRFQKYRKAQR